MSDFFATLAGRDDDTPEEGVESVEPATQEKNEVTEKPAEPAEPSVAVEQKPEEPKAVLAMAKKKAAPKRKRKKAKNGDEPEGQLTIDVYQTDDDIVVKSTIAGVDTDDLDISITEDTITIRGERDQDDEVDEEHYYYRELYWGSFSRSIILPVEVDPDQAAASIKDGVLTVRVPKSSRSKERKVNVKRA